MKDRRIIESGKLPGDPVTWTLDDQGTLELKGTGIAHAYSSYYNPCPHALSGVSEQIRKIVVGPDITGIAPYFFSWLDNLESVFAPVTCHVDEKELANKCPKATLHRLAEKSVPACEDMGRAGPNATWRFYSDGTLCIDGTGNTFPFTAAIPPSYKEEYGDRIKRVVVGHGITHIGMGAFEGLENLTEVEISDTVKHVGDRAFFGCKSLEKAVVLSTDVSFGENVFPRNEGLTIVGPNECLLKDVQTEALGHERGHDDSDDNEKDDCDER